jgi:hypothetical protein
VATEGNDPRLRLQRLRPQTTVVSKEDYNDHPRLSNLWQLEEGLSGNLQ